MAQLGSVSATPVKAFTASSYQNECSSATARVNCCCASALQETGKPTSPTLPIACACNAVGTSDIVRTEASSALRSEIRAIAVALLFLSMTFVAGSPWSGLIGDARLKRPNPIIRLGSAEDHRKMAGCGRPTLACCHSWNAAYGENSTQPRARVSTLTDNGSRVGSRRVAGFE